jgi:hypothetical protein
MVLLAGLAGGAAVCLLAPDYVFSRGFPLDDAWIHAVYGRSLARSGVLAYNPGVPATGATSPLWALVLALPHAVTSQLPALLLGTKLLGFALHVVAALLLFVAFTWRAPVGVAELVGCMLMAFHPDLVSASISGMEVPLATAAACGLLLAAVGPGALVYGVLSFVAPLARPELTLVCLALPLALLIRRDHRRLVMLTGAACVGNALAYGVIGARNFAVSGRPLPATFYAKVGSGTLDVIEAQAAGFSELLGRLPIVDSSILLAIASLLAVRVVSARQAQPAPLERAAAALLAGLLFCAASFVLVPPIDPRAFYHQRYILPALPFVVAAMPVLLSSGLERLVPERAYRLGQMALFGLLVLSVLVVARFRYDALANDAHNIDDVQVSIGRHLASTDSHDVVWAVDAGAVRYFGNAFVVDLLGLNNAELLGPDAQPFLDRHAPRYIEAVPTWSSIDTASGRRLTATQFRTSTPYTTTSFAPMQQHWLVLCDDPEVSGQVAIRARTFAFRCADRRPRVGTP